MIRSDSEQPNAARGVLTAGTPRTCAATCRDRRMLWDSASGGYSHVASSRCTRRKSKWTQRDKVRPAFGTRLPNRNPNKSGQGMGQEGVVHDRRDRRTEAFPQLPLGNTGPGSQGKRVLNPNALSRTTNHQQLMAFSFQWQSQTYDPFRPLEPYQKPRYPTPRP